MQFPSSTSSSEGSMYRMNAIAEKCEQVGIEERDRECFLPGAIEQNLVPSQFPSPRIKLGLSYCMLKLKMREN